MASSGPVQDFDKAPAPSTPSHLERDKATANQDPVNVTGSGVEDSGKSNATTATALSGSADSTPLSSPGASPAASPSPEHRNDNEVLGETVPNKQNMTSKKRKMPFEEAQLERAIKASEAQKKAEDKAKKLEEKRVKDELKKEEKRVKDEEKRIKDEEREKARLEKEKKQAAREEERKIKAAEREKKEQEKEAAKKAKEEEKAKKERSQPKLWGFIQTKKAQPSVSPSQSRRNSIASLNEAGAQETQSAIRSEYDKAFPAFFVKEHVTVAPSCHFPWDVSRVDNAIRAFDEIVNQASIGEQSMEIDNHASLKRTLDEALCLQQAKRMKYNLKPASVRQLVHQINNGSREEPIEIETGSQKSRNALNKLSQVPMKRLKYTEDVRPAYFGTFTKQPRHCSAKKLCRNPTFRAFHTDDGVNYDYDSEAEWEEPDEDEGDEELRSDDEDDEDDDDGDDINDFLDDEGDPSNRRKLLEDKEPAYTGLVWNDSGSHSLKAVPFGETTIDLHSMGLTPLILSAIGPIDPFSTAYWERGTQPATQSVMGPPPAPFGSSGIPSLACGISGVTLAPSSTTLPKAKGNVKPLPAELLADFKQAVDGSDLSKIGLVEVLKKKFPKVTQKTIQTTLEQVAKREGSKESEKKWKLLQSV